MNLNWMRAKQTKFTAYATLYIAIVVAVLATINFLANRHNKSYDATSNKRFSLSEQTTKLAGQLKGDVKITYWDTTDRFQGAKDLLDRYNNLSPKITVDYKDPDKNPNEARAAGVRTLGTTFIEANGRREEAKAVSEQEVTGALIRALKGGKRTVCAATGSGEHQFDDGNRDGYQQAKEYLESNNYATKDLPMVQKPEIASDCDIVMVAGPTRAYFEPEVKAIQSFVESGKAALIMIDPPIQFAGDQVDEQEQLVKVLDDWGVTPGKDIIIDQNPLGQLFGLGPASPLISSYGTHPIVRDMRGLTTIFPLARSLTIKTGGKALFEKLLSTSNDSFITDNLKSDTIHKAKDGPFDVAVAGRYDTAGKDGQRGRIVVAGSSQWADNANLRRAPGNRDLFMNMMNWLSADEDLISIRPKEPEDRRLSLSAGQMRSIFWGSVVILPLMIVGLGMSVWWKRR